EKRCYSGSPQIGTGKSEKVRISLSTAIRMGIVPRAARQKLEQLNRNANMKLLVFEEEQQRERTLSEDTLAGGGSRDALFAPVAEALMQVSGGRAELWREPGRMGGDGSDEHPKGKHQVEHDEVDDQKRGAKNNPDQYYRSNIKHNLELDEEILLVVDSADVVHQDAAHNAKYSESEEQRRDLVSRGAEPNPAAACMRGPARNATGRDRAIVGARTRMTYVFNDLSLFFGLQSVEEEAR
ncbi:unnamed protein product, partial [Amoebophrya sp. A25]